MKKILGKCCFLDSWIEIQSCLVAAMSIQGTSAQCQLITVWGWSVPINDSPCPWQPSTAHGNSPCKTFIYGLGLRWVRESKSICILATISSFGMHESILTESSRASTTCLKQSNAPWSRETKRTPHKFSVHPHTHRCHWWQHSSDDLATAFSAKDGVRIEPKLRKKLPWHKKGTACRHNKSTGATGPTYKRKRLGNLVRGWMQLFGKCM